MYRITHSRTRKRARLRLQRRSPPRRIVVVCHGNICRSPYAAAYLRHRLTHDGVVNVDVSSAGIIGPDRPANERGAAIAMSRGLDLRGHRSRLFTTADAERADLVLVMTRSQRKHLINQFCASPNRIELLGDFDVLDPPYREIEDPYGKSDTEFIRVFGQIDRSIEGLCARWVAQGGEQGEPEGGPAW